MTSSSNNRKKILLFPAICLIVFCMFLLGFSAFAWSDELSVQVQKNGQLAVVAAYSQADLSALPQSQLKYSSLDANNVPTITIAQGVTINTLLSELGISSSDVTGLSFASSDGWKRSYDAGPYLKNSRYYYPQIVDGYDTEADNPLDFASSVISYKKAVEPMLAVKSYEGRMEADPAASSLTAAGGIRFCFGQTAITDAVSMNFGKHIKSLTINLSADSSYNLPQTGQDPNQTGGNSSPIPPEQPAPSSQGEAEEIENAGLRADTLTITVGYYGSTYYTKKVFTLSELQAMEQVKQVYSYIDNMPAPCLDSAVGVRLSDILQAAGIDVNSIQSFHFYCADVARTWYLSSTKDYLLDTIRYYYPNQTEHWDYDEAKALAGATEGAEQVETIIALEDNWRRFATDANFAETTTSTRFRLLFGQTDVKTPTSSRSAKWVHTIAVTLGGSPPKGIAMDESILDLEIGSEYQLQANVAAMDETTDKRVTWTSSDESIVSVNSSGKIVVKGEGSAVITATTLVGGLTASVVINASAEGAAVSDVTSRPPLQGGGQGNSGSGNSDNIFEINPKGQPAKSPTDAAPSNAAVQNWRVYEMSESAVALTEIDDGDNPLTLPTATGAGLLLAGGITARSIFFFRRIK